MSGMSGRYEAWAWVTLIDGEESLVGAMVNMEGVGPAHMPLLHRNRTLVEGQFGPLARAHAAMTGQPVRLVHLLEEQT